MTSPSLPIGPGSVIEERYRILDILAVGGSGTVYRAIDGATEEPVALKLMHAAHQEEDSERKRFLREAKIVSELEHDHIVPLLDWGHTDGGLPYLVFPLLEGRPLSKRLERHDPIDPIEAGELAIQTLEALEALHRRGIAHRDIKPANIFLEQTAQGETVRLLDFGLAKGGGGQANDVTRMGAVVGTPRYMAPEQARGERVGPAADIYAMGLVLCEMVTGEPLVTSKADLEIYVAHGSDRALKLPAAVAGTAFGPIVQRAISKQPQARYRTATQMLADVEAATATLAAGDGGAGPAELEVTQRRRGTGSALLSVPNETSERLRSVFNRLAATAKDAAGAEWDDDPASSSDVPDDRPTIRQSVPQAQASLPIALVRRIPPPEDEAD
ncbi:MAG: serine/threonine protein kinase [Myxococcales bacterium]|nr:serine/threonine protein kinase [Myxococcales bacterium]